MDVKTGDKEVCDSVTNKVYDYKTVCNTCQDWVCKSVKVCSRCRRWFFGWVYYDCNCAIKQECGWGPAYDCSCSQQVSGSHYETVKYNCRSVPVYESRSSTCSANREVCDSCTDYSNCLRTSTRSVAYDCKDIEIKSITVNRVYADKVDVSVSYEAQVNSWFSFYFDLVSGSWGNCRKLTCGLPSADTDCGVGKCESAASTTLYLYKGSGVVRYNISVPLFDTQSYELYAGAWRNNQLISGYYYGSVKLEEPRISFYNIQAPNSVLSGNVFSASFDYSSNYQGNLLFVFDLRNSTNVALVCGNQAEDTGCVSEQKWNEYVSYGTGSKSFSISVPNNYAGDYNFYTGAWYDKIGVGGVQLFSKYVKVVNVRLGEGASCSSSAQCVSGLICHNTYCSTAGCDYNLNLLGGSGCDCSDECVGGLICSAGTCVSPCTQSDSCDSCLDLSIGSHCDCNSECNSNFCNSLGVCSVQSSISFANSKLCADSNCVNLVNDSVGVGSNLFLSGSLNGVSGSCNLSYNLNACSDSYSGIISNCGSVLWIIPVKRAGLCQVSLSLNDNVNRGAWGGNVAAFSGSASSPVINPNINSGLYFEPSSGNFVSSIEGGNFDIMINDLINSGWDNERIIEYLTLSVLGAGVLLTLTQRRRLFEYLMNLRSDLSNNFLSLIDGVWGSGLTPVGRQYSWDEGRRRAAVDSQLVHSTFTGFINDRRLPDDIYAFDFSVEQRERNISDAWVNTGRDVGSFGFNILLAGFGIVGAGFVAAPFSGGASLVLVHTGLAVSIFGGLISAGGGAAQLLGRSWGGAFESDSALQAFDYGRQNSGEIILNTVGLAADVITFNSDWTDLLNNLDDFATSANRVTNSWAVNVVADSTDDVLEGTDEIIVTMKNLDETDELKSSVDNIIDNSLGAVKMSRFSELPDTFVTQIKRIGLYDKIDDFKIVDGLKKADFAVELVNGKWVLNIKSSVDLSKVTDYSLIHEMYEIITETFHPSESSVLNMINSIDVLADIDQSIKSDIFDIIYDRLIADNALLKDYPYLLSDIIDINERSSELSTFLFNNDVEGALLTMPDIAFYELITGNTVEVLFLKGDMLTYYNAIKDVMGEFI